MGLNIHANGCIHYADAAGPSNTHSPASPWSVYPLWFTHISTLCCRHYVSKYTRCTSPMMPALPVMIHVEGGGGGEGAGTTSHCHCRRLISCQSCRFLHTVYNPLLPMPSSLACVTPLHVGMALTLSHGTYGSHSNLDLPLPMLNLNLQHYGLAECMEPPGHSLMGPYNSHDSTRAFLLLPWHFCSPPEYKL